MKPVLSPSALKTAATLSLAFLAGACGGKQAPSPSAPPLILVTVDTLRADRLGCYGYFRDTSPRVDEFAGEAALFENAVTPMATTLPAHVSLMTSLHPMAHGVEGNYEYFEVPLAAEGEIQTLAQRLARRGYGTAAFVSSVSVKSLTGLGAGFEVYGETQNAERRAEETTDAALEWLDGRRPGEPFFLWIHYFDPHGPYAPPPPCDSLYKPSEAQALYFKERGFPVEDHPELERINDLYDGEVHYTDSQLGRLLDAVKAKEIYNDSLIVFTSDHGEGLGQHGWMDHGQIYNEQIFVPLLVKFPGASPWNGKRLSPLTTLMDVTPILAEEAGLPLEMAEKTDGVNTMRRPRTSALLERTPRQRDWGPGRLHALLTPEWIFFDFTEADDMLFNMQNDKHQLHDVINTMPAVARSLKAELGALVAQYNEEKELRRHGAPGNKEQEQLKSLGYVQ